jgi:hypothetical protein
VLRIWSKLKVARNRCALRWVGRIGHNFKSYMFSTLGTT